MTSTNTVIIDWSATPVNLFAQIDAYTRTPVADLYNYKLCYTSLNNILTTKDILTYDIDIYLKFREHSLLPEESLPSQISLDEDEIAPEESLPSQILSDEEEIAPASSSPITSSCDQDISKDIIPPSTIIAPTFSFLKITFYSQSERINPDEISINLDSKDTHARTTYNRWNKQKMKKIISNRLGLSYNTRISANNIDSILKKGRTYMYNKVYNNLTFVPSNKANVKKKQTARFERHCRRILHNSALTENATVEDKLIACKRKGFLFLPSAEFTKPVMHLRYKKKYQIPLQRYYNFKIPSLKASRHADIKQEVHIANYFNSTKHNVSFDPLERSNDVSTSHDSDVISSPIRTISSTLNVNSPVFTPSKKVKPIIHNEPVILPIPDELLPYVPTEPIYKNGLLEQSRLV
ncbi:unnamed protein product [Rhizophagus irregularis]|nr:unnamed protein product [Rhizophagus irregularis]